MLHCHSSFVQDSLAFWHISLLQFSLWWLKMPKMKLKSGAGVAALGLLLHERRPAGSEHGLLIVALLSTLLSVAGPWHSVLLFIADSIDSMMLRMNSPSDKWQNVIVIIPGLPQKRKRNDYSIVKMSGRVHLYKRHRWQLTRCEGVEGLSHS